MQGYNLGNYSQQLGLSQDELGRAYQAAGGQGNPYAAQVAPQQTAQPVQQQGGLQTVGQMHDLSQPAQSSSKDEKKSGLDNALGIVGKILSFL